MKFLPLVSVFAMLCLSFLTVGSSDAGRLSGAHSTQQHSGSMDALAIVVITHHAQGDTTAPAMCNGDESHSHTKALRAHPGHAIDCQNPCKLEDNCSTACALMCAATSASAVSCAEPLQPFVTVTRYVLSPQDPDDLVGIISPPLYRPPIIGLTVPWCCRSGRYHRRHDARSWNR